MSQTRTFSVSKDTVVRKRDDGSGGQGCGQSKHIYVGRSGSAGTRRNYDSFMEFTLNWTDVAKINSATLNLYTDEFNTYGTAGEPGIMAAPGTTHTPKFKVCRLTEEFTEGNNVDGDFDATDYVWPARTTSYSKVKYLSAAEKGANQLVQIDITGIVKAWAPATVQGGGKQHNHGIGLYGYSETTQNWSGWSSEHSVPAERPTITLNYELGPTIPDTPSTSMAPDGAVTSVTQFEGDFSDIRATDTLQSTEIEIYDAGVAGTATASNNNVTKTAHGLIANDVIYFTSLTGGAGLSLFTPYYVKTPNANAFLVSLTPGGATVDITSNASALTYSRQVAKFNGTATETDRTLAHFIVPSPPSFVPVAGTTYRWRARVKDQEGQFSAWCDLISFNTTNTNPVVPTLSPVTGTSVDTMNLLKFEGGTFSDADGDTLNAHQIQLSPFPSGDARWDEADGILWDTGKSYDPSGSTSWVDYYGGPALAAGTYYWRARQWDSREGVSAWSTVATLILTTSFDPEPGSYDKVQVNFNAPWRIMIRDLYQADGVTKTVGRAPGRLIAVLEEAKNVGASIVFNSPGELHFTLLKDDPQISVIEPKQVHYAVEFYSGDGWQEKYAGVVWDVDATDTDVVFKGIDYLALFDTLIDERYDPLKPDKSYKNNGSYYSDVTVRNIILDQLKWAKKQPDSWVGFIRYTAGTIAAMNEKVSVYSTMQPCLSFMSGLIDSHRQGTGKRTRMSVKKSASGTYYFWIEDDPGTTRSDLALHYGELVQGYRIIIFGDGWANVEHVIGRNRDGVKVTYKTIKGQAFQPSTSTYGRIATVAVMDGVTDAIDLQRRGRQAAIQSAKLGKNIAIGIRTKYLSPLQGWDVTDVFPVSIVDGSIDTGNFGSGFWWAAAAAWEATDVGQQSLVITLLPREDTSSPDPDLLPSQAISTQPEWQLGWQAPDPLKATSKFWLDQSTGIVYVRDETTATLIPVTGTA